MRRLFTGRCVRVLVSRERLLETGIDGAALKPTEVSLARAADLPFDLLTVDYEGRAHTPDPDALRSLSATGEVRVTVPVRADGFDPLGDDGAYRDLPAGVGTVVVAGHPAYLSPSERRRAVAPRFGAAVDRFEDAWVGTEGVERLALATGATQYLLLSPTVDRELRSLRAAGFEGGLAVYAPTAFATDDDAALDAVGAYVARRGPVRRRLPDDPVVDGRASGRTREVLLSETEDYALIGDPDDVARRVDDLRDAGADHVVGYPARGLSEFLGG